MARMLLLGFMHRLVFKLMYGYQKMGIITVFDQIIIFTGGSLVVSTG